MKLVGTQQPIHDARGKASGRLRYACDLTYPGMAHLAMVFSAIPHGYVTSIDASEALAMDGVYAVLHAFNTPEYRFNHYRTQFQSAQDLPLEECVFQRYVRFTGDRVAVVAARDEETARRAAALVKVEYEKLPCALDFDQALSGIHCLDGKSPIEDEGTMTVGTPQPDEAEGIQITVHNELSRLHHAAMETHACVADYDPDEDELTIRSPSQAVFGIRTVVADMLSMPYNRVRVVKTTMGGSFGGKQEWMLEPVCAVAAKILKRPVKLVYDRAETMRSTYCRAAMRGDLRGTFRKDGTLLRLDLDILLDAGAYVGNSLDYVRAPFGKFFRCYRVPCATLHSRVVSTNTTPSGAFRSWGVAEYYVFMEHLLNKASEVLGIDPVELRLKNVLLPGEMDIKMGLPVEEARTRECLLQGAAHFQWEEKRREDARFNASSHRYKRGTAVACAGHTNTYYTRFNDFAGVEARMCDDGTVQANVSIHDHGCGTVQAFKMILAEELELPTDLIRMKEADTACTPYDYGCFSSRSTFVVGRAVQECGKNLRREICRSAAQMLHVPEDQLYLQEGTVRWQNNDQVSLTYEQVSQWTILNLRKELFADSRYHNMSNPTVTGTHFARVEVDTWTGLTKVLDYLAVHDVGQAINPAMCIAQTQGAVQMGCGAALREQMTISPDGRSVNSLAKYHLMNAPDLPDIQVELIQDGPSQEGPFGAKSIGEVGMAPVAAAVAGAVNQALDADLQVIPMDPDRIVEYITKRGY